jgi:hypothetical protein
LTLHSEEFHLMPLTECPVKQSGKLRARLTASTTSATPRERAIDAGCLFTKPL